MLFLLMFTLLLTEYRGLSCWFKHILLSNIYNGIEHKFYNLYKVIYPVSYIHRSDREHDG